MIVLSKTSIFVALYERGAKPGDDVPETGAWLSPLRVAGIVDLAKGNGSRR